MQVNIVMMYVDSILFHVSIFISHAGIFDKKLTCTQGAVVFHICFKWSDSSPLLFRFGKGYIVFMTKNFYEVRRLFWVFCNFVCFCDFKCWVWDKYNSDRFFKFHRQVLNYGIIPASSRVGPLSCIGTFYQEVFTCNLCIKIWTRLPFYKRYKKNCTCDDLINTFF